MKKVQVDFTADRLAGELSTANRAKQVATTLVINDQNDAEQAAGLVRDVKRKRKELDVKRKSVTDALRKCVNEVNGWFKQPDTRLEEAEDALKTALANWAKATAEIQRKAFAAADAAHRAGDDAKAREALAVANNAAAARLPKGVSVRWVWKANVVDAPSVPERWKCVDEKQLAAYAKTVPADMVPEQIPGVEFVKDSIVSIRDDGKDSDDE